MIAGKVRGLGGSVFEAGDLEQLRGKVALPDDLVQLLTSVPIVGLRLSVSTELDRSGLGVEMQWMNRSEMLDEACEAFPGIVAVERGYVPIGVCLEGSGDPYFYRASDGAIVRVPHDAATEHDLDEGLVEVVADSVEALIEAAVIEPP